MIGVTNLGAQLDAIADQATRAATPPQLLLGQLLVVAEQLRQEAVAYRDMAYDLLPGKSGQ